jgi:transposase/IS5 family transposase
MRCGMPRYKPVERNALLLPVVLTEQIQPGTFEFALDHLVDHELDLARLDGRFRNEHTGASAYDPRVMLKIVLLAYSRGLISSRAIERACRENVLFMAIGGDAQPSYTHIAKFVRELGQEVQPLFTQVLLTCDRLGLIGRQMFAIDGVKLPSNASKERSGTHAELRHRAERLDKAARKMIELHRSQDSGAADEGAAEASRERRIEALVKEAQATREFLARAPQRRNRKGQELKSNVTDNDSAKMATGKGVIQGYAAQAAVDASHQVIVAADVTGSGSEQAMLMPMIEQMQGLRAAHTLITADAGYHSEENMTALREAGIAALVADGQMRKRDERLAARAHHLAKGDPLHDKRQLPAQTIRLFRPSDFMLDAASNSCSCPAGQRLYSSGSRCQVNGRIAHKFKGTVSACGNCQLRAKCLRHPERTRIRQVAIFLQGQSTSQRASEEMKRAIDSARGRRLYGQRIATVEPVFGNLRHNKRLDRFTLRGKAKVRAQWCLYCLVHNIEKLARNGYR